MKKIPQAKLFDYLVETYPDITWESIDNLDFKSYRGTLDHYFIEFKPEPTQALDHGWQTSILGAVDSLRLKATGQIEIKA